MPVTYGYLWILVQCVFSQIEGTHSDQFLHGSCVHNMCETEYGSELWGCDSDCYNRYNDSYYEDDLFYLDYGYPSCYERCSEPCGVCRYRSGNTTLVCNVCNPEGNDKKDLDVQCFKCDSQCGACQEYVTFWDGSIDTTSRDISDQYMQKYCHDGCIMGVCYKENGTCLLGCKRGRYGSRCDVKCDNCINDNCDADGKCLEGCRPGRHGNTCDTECDNCFTSKEVSGVTEPTDVGNGNFSVFVDPRSNGVTADVTNSFSKMSNESNGSTGDNNITIYSVVIVCLSMALTGLLCFAAIRYFRKRKGRQSQIKNGSEYIHSIAGHTTNTHTDVALMEFSNRNNRIGDARVTNKLLDQQYADMRTYVTGEVGGATGCKQDLGQGSDVTQTSLKTIHSKYDFDNDQYDSIEDVRYEKWLHM